MKKSKKIDYVMSLKELRKLVGLKQHHIKGFKQASVSKIESRRDIKISTLIDYVHELGLELEVRAVGKADENGEIPSHLLIRTDRRVEIPETPE